MARVILCNWGSHGDFDPYLGIALGLRDRGHQVTLASLAHYRDFAVARGLGFQAIRPAGDPTDTALIRRLMHPVKGSEYIVRDLVFPAVEEMYEDIDGIAGGADLIVSHPLTPAASMVAHRRKIAWASSVLAPMSFLSRFDFPVLPPAPWLKSLDALGTWPAALLGRLARRQSRGWSAPVHALRRRLGLPAIENAIFEGQHSPDLVLALFSHVLASPQPDWPRHVEVTGHVFHDAPHGTALSQELEQFLAAGPAPVVFTLGSSAVLVPGEFWKESIAAIRRVGTRAVLVVGAGNAARMQATLPSDVLAVDAAPHSLLMPRASVVVQQCGIGTLAQSLRSGRPMLAVPFAHDQPDNAWRAAGLGMARIVNVRSYRAARVARELDVLLRDTGYTDAAARTAARVRAEHGVAAACDAIERRFDLALRRRSA